MKFNGLHTLSERHREEENLAPSLELNECRLTGIPSPYQLSYPGSYILHILVRMARKRREEYVFSQHWLPQVKLDLQ
jgi:hypothetical protein